MMVSFASSWTRAAALLVFGVLCASVASAQQQSSATSASATREQQWLAQGWGFLATNDPARALTFAQQILKENPNSTAGLTLAVDAELARGGGLVGLTQYEAWLGTRRTEEAFVLRRVARVFLREATREPLARQLAIDALVADGDPDFKGQAIAGTAAGSFGETRALAASGSDDATRKLISQLEAQPSGRSKLIEALALTHNKLAIAPLIKLLDDPDLATRASAAEALGALDAAEAVGKLRSLNVETQPFPVRFSAAGALVKLRDPAAQAWLADILQSPDRQGKEYSMLRIQAAEKLAAAGPSTGWMAATRQLLDDPDPQIRVKAAALLGPYDPATAGAVLENAHRDQNAAVRDLAGQTLADKVAGDFATLRRLMRSPDALTRVQAAARVLSVTR